MAAGAWLTVVVLLARIDVVLLALTGSIFFQQVCILHIQTCWDDKNGIIYNKGSKDTAELISTICVQNYGDQVASYVGYYDSSFYTAIYAIMQLPLWKPNFDNLGINIFHIHM